ncbi:MAG TPA: c-type cytochrome [Thermoanaerobaculia bacterium]|nr:c-type cytochrome [Thermoanaerobaculia bacterium]
MRRFLALCFLAFTYCSTPIPVRFGAHQSTAPVIAISNPTFMEGNAIAGRRAFIDAQCIDCHRVGEDPRLPAGPRSIAGPLLEGMDRYEARELARRITSREAGSSEELFNRTMKDYAQPITARQLVDIVAYLRNPKRAAA